MASAFRQRSAEEIHRIVWFLRLFLFTDLFGVSLVIPLLPTVYQQVQLDKQWRGWFSSVFGIAQLAGGYVTGRVSDTHGRKAVLYINCFGATLAYCLIGFSVLVDQVALAWFLLLMSRAIVGLVKQSYTVSSAIISDICVGDRRTSELSRLSSAAGMAFVIGPLISPFLGYLGGGTYVPLFAATMILFSCGIAVWLFLEETRQPQSGVDPQKIEKKGKQPKSAGARATTAGDSNDDGSHEVNAVITRSAARRMAATSSHKSKASTAVDDVTEPATEVVGEEVVPALPWIVYCVACARLFNELGVNLSRNVMFLSDAGSWKGIEIPPLGTIMSVSSTAGVLTNAFVIPYITHRISTLRMLQLSSVGFLVVGVAATSPIFTSVPGYFALLCLRVFFCSGVTQSCTSLLSHLAGRNRVGRVLGLASSFDSVAYIVAPLAVGYLLQYASVEAVDILSAVCAGVVVVLVFMSVGKDYL